MNATPPIIAGILVLGLAGSSSHAHACELLETYPRDGAVDVPPEWRYLRWKSDKCRLEVSAVRTEFGTPIERNTVSAGEERLGLLPQNDTVLWTLRDVGNSGLEFELSFETGIRGQPEPPLGGFEIVEVSDERARSGRRTVDVLVSIQEETEHSVLLLHGSSVSDWALAEVPGPVRLKTEVATGTCASVVRTSYSQTQEERVWLCDEIGGCSSVGQSAVLQRFLPYLALPSLLLLIRRRRRRQSQGGPAGINPVESDGRFPPKDS